MKWNTIIVEVPYYCDKEVEDINEQTNELIDEEKETITLLSWATGMQL